MHRGLLSMHAPLRSDNASRSNACGWHWITLVPTARLELAQLSPLPPQDSVSTNFTTSALSRNPGKQLLIAANRFKTRIITGLTSLFNAQKPILAKIYFGTSEPEPDEATGAEAAAADAGGVAGAVTA